MTKLYKCYKLREPVEYKNAAEAIAALQCFACKEQGKRCTGPTEVKA